MTGRDPLPADAPSPPWLMPIRPEMYLDGCPRLTDAERALLEAYVTTPPQGFEPMRLLRRLPRFETPFRATVELTVTHEGQVATARRHLFRAMLDANLAFWAWPEDRWIATIDAAPVGGHYPGGTRFWLLNLAYLFGGLLYIGASATYGLMADAVFGKALVDEQVDLLRAPLVAAGFSSSYTEWRHFRWTCAFALLLNRNPYIAALTADCLRTVHERLGKIPSTADRHGRRTLYRVEASLLQRGILDRPALAPSRPPASDGPPLLRAADPAVDPRWLAWARAFYEQTPRRPGKTLRDICCQVLTAGRWLHLHHPEVTEPDQWDEALAAEYVAHTCAAFRGELTCPAGVRYAEYQRARRPLTPRGINTRLGGMRSFFAHLQRRPYTVDGVPRPKLRPTWNPAEAFRTPEHLVAACQPDPRDIQEDTWLKLIWAACALTAEQVRTVLRTPQYPVAYYRAACLLWVTARRPDEIRRLALGCVSREWAPEMRDEQGHLFEAAAELCYLRVPTNKLRGEFYVPIPAYAADAVEVWERLRPANQEALADPKTERPTRYLFQYRNEMMGKNFLNDSVIPLLCALAGVARTDAVGRITPHRARATTATLLRKLGMAPTDIGQLLGHTDPAKSLPWYLREDKHHLGRVYRKANPLDRYVAAALDVDAQAKGEPCVFYYLADGPDGRPRMCGNPHFARCVHQMACIECEAFIDHDVAEAIERREGVLTVAVPIPLPPQVVAALDDEGNSMVTDGLRHIPPPALPGPAFHFNTTVAPCARDAEGEDLRARLTDLEALMMQKRGKVDRRSASVQAIVQEMDRVRMLLAAREQDD